MSESSPKESAEHGDHEPEAKRPASKAKPPTHPWMEFPFLLLKFISASEKTHPHVVRWSPCGSQFFVDKNSKELEKMLASHFNHGNYESLRRQLNFYGFRKNSANKFWSRQGSVFHRDSPGELKKVRPRPGSHRMNAMIGAQTITEKRTSDSTIRFSSHHVAEKSTSPAMSCLKSPVSQIMNETSVSSEKLSGEESNIQSLGASAKATLCSTMNSPSSEADEQSTRKNSSSPSSDTELVRSNREAVKRGPVAGFPALLHQLIEYGSVMHPDMVAWNITGTSFKIEMHHPHLGGLLLKYFRHGNYSSLRQQLHVYGFRRDGNGYYRNEAFSLGNYSNVAMKAQSKYGVKKTSNSRKNNPTSRNPPQEETTVPVPASSVDQHSEANSDSESEASSDESSSFFDHDLSTYATLKTDEMSFERLDSRQFDERSFERLNDCDDDDDDAAGPNKVESAESNDADMSDEEPATAPKFQILQKVYARDKDGVMYTAVIRRQLYGPQYHRQVEMGLVSSKEEAQELLEDEDHEAMWHYFVHYNNWNVSFDRWVSESNVYEMTEEVIAYAERLSKDHRTLQKEMRKPGTKAKKQWQTIDGAVFLREWKKRLVKVGQEMNFEQGSSTVLINDEVAIEPEVTRVKSDPASMKPAKQTTWTKAALIIERKLREQGLSGKRPQSQANAIVLPFALKKILVQQWEFISQCRMMPSLPAPTSVRQALNTYLESKNIIMQPTKPDVEPQSDGDAMQIDADSGIAKTECQGDGAAVTDKMSLVEGEGVEDSGIAKTEDQGDGAAVTDKMSLVEGEGVEADSREQEWRDMADGIAMLFDEALASRLLYCEELPQLRVMDNLSEYSMMPYSELYGCEHLLRLFVRLPEMLADKLSDAEARPILAKVNDFVRFLHKNHGTLLTQTHRKLNDLELKEQQKLIKLEEKKRKSQVDTEVLSSKKMRHGST